MSGAVEIAAILHWQHRRGGAAHCLARLHRPAPPVRPVAVVSEIRSNLEDHGISGDLPAIGVALLGALPEGIIHDPADIAWIAHHGEFSYYDAQDAPETFTDIGMRWDGHRYQDDPQWHRLLRPSEIATALNGVRLEPVPDTLRRLGWRY